MSELFNLDALENDANQEPFRFMHGGEEYTLPASPDMRAGIAFQKEDAEGGLRLLLGNEQWARIEASDAVFDTNKFVKLMAAYEAHIGVAVGESQASSPSSKSTARPSKRTSNGTTRRSSQVS